MKEWYYTKMGLQQGPISEEELRKKIQRQEFGETSLFWTEGMGDWLPLSKIGEFSGLHNQANLASGGSGPMTPAGPANQVNPGGHQTLQQGPVLQRAAVEDGPPNYLVHSIIALVLSSIGGSVICVTLLATPMAVVALVYATKVNPLKIQGRMMEAHAASRMAKIWMLVSFIVLAVIVLGGIGILILFVLGLR